MDISKCPSQTCARREDCYRHMAMSYGFWQSWLCESPEKEDGECDIFLGTYEYFEKLNSQ